MLNPQVRLHIDDTLLNYCEITRELNHKALTQPEEILEQDRIVQRWLEKEKLQDVIRPHLKQSIELFTLTRNNIRTVLQLLADEGKANEFRLRLMKIDYVKAMDCLLTDRDAALPSPNLKVLYLNGKYKPFQICSSRTIRQYAYPRQEMHPLKLELEDPMGFIKRLSKVKCTRLKNLGLRLIHGDIFTKEKLHQKGIIDDPTCDKCNQTETTKHLLHQCWYSGRIWSRIKKLYENTDNRPTIYNIDTDFALANCQGTNKPKLLLHLEILRLLTQKNRPTALPRTIIKTAIDYLLVCERQANTKRYLRKLSDNLERH